MQANPRRVHFVLASVLRNVHDRLIESYGGVPGIRDENAFLSAIARPENLAAYGDDVDLPVLAAALPWAILRNHPFTDGNKRTALAALSIFIERNGWELTCTEVEETAMVLRAASSAIDENEWTAWVRHVARPR